MPVWLEHFLSVLGGSDDATVSDHVLVAALIGCSLITVGQLLTMLATRWGDHHALAKSFFVSVLIHVCLGLGWATAVRNSPPPLIVREPEQEQPIPIRDLLEVSEQDLSQPEPGNTALWREPPERPDPDLKRSEREFTASSSELPRDQASPPAPLVELNHATSAVEPQEAPPLELPQPLPPPAAAVTAEALAAPETTALPDAGPVAAAPQSVARPVVSDTFVDSVMTRGSALRVAPEPNPQSASIPLPTAESAELPIVEGETTDQIVRRSSPQASPVGDPVPGATTPPAISASDGSRFSRINAGRTNPSPGEIAPLPKEKLPAPTLLSHAPSTSTKPTFVNPVETDAPPAIFQPMAPARSLPAAPATAATTYKLRRLDRRKEIALQNGGTEASEQAVEMALAWLAAHQEAEGYWDADKHGGGLREVRRIDANKPPGGRETDTGLTGLAILSFLGAGHTHEEGDYTREVSLAIRWLIAMQRSDGYLGGRATYYDQMYCHAIATYALAEAYGMQSDPARFPNLRDAVERGVWYICQTQNKDGGWRYRAGLDESDMSMFGWQLMALKSAQLAGLAVPDDVRRGMIQFLRDRSRGIHGGLAGYKEADPPTPAMTAEALFCKQMYGLRRASAASREAIEYLQTHIPKLSSPDEYYWYYGTLAMFQYGGEPWQRWNDALRDTLIRLQRKQGDAAGSWDPVGPWGPVGGRIYSTTLCVLCLEVYYRFLPLYQVGEE